MKLRKQKTKKLYRSAKPKRCVMLPEVYKNIASIISLERAGKANDNTCCFIPTTLQHGQVVFDRKHNRQNVGLNLTFAMLLFSCKQSLQITSSYA